MSTAEQHTSPATSVWHKTPQIALTPASPARVSPTEHPSPVSAASVMKGRADQPVQAAAVTQQPYKEGHTLFHHYRAIHSVPRSFSFSPLSELTAPRKSTLYVRVGTEKYLWCLDGGPSRTLPLQQTGEHLPIAASGKQMTLHLPPTADSGQLCHPVLLCCVVSYRGNLLYCARGR